MKYRKVLQNLFLIRKTEELISKEYHKNIFRCPVHLSIGQEAISAAINFVFNSKDLAVSSLTDPRSLHWKRGQYQEYVC